MIATRIAPWAFAILVAMTIGVVPADAGPAYRVARAPDPAPDDPLREEKLADRKRIAELNNHQARTTAARDRRYLAARDNTNARAQARYQAAMADWRRRVAACRAGDWSQCDR